MVQQVKKLAAKTDDLSWKSRTYTVEKENQHTQSNKCKKKKMWFKCLKEHNLSPQTLLVRSDISHTRTLPKERYLLEYRAFPYILCLFDLSLVLAQCKREVNYQLHVKGSAKARYF